MQPVFPDIIIFFFFFPTLFLISITNPQLILSANTTPNDHLQHPDYEALLAIKAQISSDPHSKLLSWRKNNSIHLCKWEGITCGHRHNNRVVILSLRSSNLVGTLSPFVGNLTFLHELALYNNSFRGEIPHQISHLHRLIKLNLVSNSFEGEIPANLSSCVHLTALGLSFNNMVGTIPPNLASLPYLTIFDITQNYFRGSLQEMGIENMSTSLQFLYLRGNLLQGSIPNGIGSLTTLVELDLSQNLITGTIPNSLFNLSSLESLSLNNIKIQGHLPQDLGLRLPKLYHLSFANTSLSGQVPTSLSNLSQLNSLVYPYNSFTGRFFLEGNNLPYLSWLNVGSAFPLAYEVRDLSFLDTMTNCTNLQHLVIGGNSFIGNFPRSVLNMSTTLQVIDVAYNQISGEIPIGLGKFVNLQALFLDNNHLTGPVPPDICKLESMQRLNFDNNYFTGEIPNSLQNMTFLSDFTMVNNNLSGSLPTSIGNCQNLQALAFSNNKLSGVLPVELFSASNLLWLVLDQNNLEGSLPDEISKLKNLVWLHISDNSFSGEIPSTLGGCTSLTELYMSQNFFVGPIPESLSPLHSIQEFDLSHNSFSGQIPSYFSTWPYLSNLNLSFNSLGGQVPTNGVFANTSVLSLVGNDKLCGGVPQLHLPKCPPIRDSKKRRLSLAVIMVISIVACVMFVVLSISLCFYFLCSSRKRKNASPELQSIKPFPDLSYQMLSRATNAFSPSNLIGGGGFGSVYKGILNQDDTELVVAIKVMNLHNQGASKAFIVECNSLRSIRHRNLVKIITACSSIDAQRNDFKALVYEFMPRGSLENWLHSSSPFPNEHHGDVQSCGLSLFQRLSIAIDVASTLEYLHTGSATPIIHCDLKPSNILLDDEMVAHVSDFGLAKFLPVSSASNNTTSETSSTQIRGTVGYAAPEYGIGSEVSREGDIYSFGIIILELVTSKKPTDPMFDDSLNLHDFAKRSLPDRVVEIIDQEMLGHAGYEINTIECIKSLTIIGVQCSLEVPQERMSIEGIVKELNFAKYNLLDRC